MVLRQELLLSFLAAGPERVDPIRIMKGMFIFGQEAPAEWLKGEGLYEFQPYNWGPFSQDVYRDLDALRGHGFVETSEERRVSWKYYNATATGRVIAQDLARRYHPKLIEFLRQVREYTLRHSFDDLLRAVYKKYPEYAVNTVFKY